MSAAALRRLAFNLDDAASYVRLCGRGAEAMVLRCAAAICRRRAREEAAAEEAERVEVTR